MKNSIGLQYDKIAQWWHDKHNASDYGLKQIERAITYCGSVGTALDVGCGSGGRIIRKLTDAGYLVTGVDASAKMIQLAQENHPTLEFHTADICDWKSDRKYNLIVAWDSIFHLPLKMHEPVVLKLCDMLAINGVLIYTFGDDYGEHESDWHDDKFYYSTIGIDANLKIIMNHGCECRHLELDQYPQKHVCIIVQKKRSCS
ncbi:MAG: class I SAM-dependent methyltransferase [Chryseolinea sp.]